MAESDGGRRIPPTWRRPAVGHGRVWLLDTWTNVPVTVEVETLRAGIHRTGLPRHTDERVADVLVTDSAVWVTRNVRLLRLDPDGSPGQIVDAGPRGDQVRWTAGADAVFGTDWPFGPLVRVGDDGSVRTAEPGRYLQRLAAGDRRLWVVDRAAETLLALDADTLGVEARVEFDHGLIEALWPVGETVLVSHDGDLDRGGFPGVWRVTADGARELVWRPPRPPPARRTGGWFAYAPRDDGRLSGLAPRIAAPDGATLWVTSTAAGPVSTITPVALPTGRTGAPIRLAGQISDLSLAYGRLWRTGFVAGRQATALTAIEIDDGRITEVDFGSVDLRSHRPRPAPVDHEAELDGLVDRLRTSLTARWHAQHPRTGERMPGIPSVHEHSTWSTWRWTERTGPCASFFAGRASPASRSPTTTA